MIIRCCECGKDITAEDKYILIQVDAGLFKLACVSHTCNYPNCDGGPATGYCHSECRGSQAGELSTDADVAASITQK